MSCTGVALGNANVKLIPASLDAAPGPQEEGGRTRDGKDREEYCTETQMR